MAVHSTGKVVRNTMLYTAATVAQKAMSFVYFWILSSQLAPAVLGSYIAMLALASIFSIGMDLGLTPLLTREAARHEGESGKMLRTVYALKIPMILVTVGLLWCWALFGLPLFDKHALTMTELTLLLGGTAIIVMDAFTAGTYAILRARQNVAVESRAIILFQFTVFLLGATALFMTRDIRFIMLALVCGSAVNAVYTIGSAARILAQPIAPRWDGAVARHLGALMPAFASAGIFTKIYQQADVVLLRTIAGNEAVGLYSVPAKITTALQTLVPGAFSAAVYPTMSNFARTDRTRLSSLFGYTFGILFVLSLPIGLILATLAPELLHLIWPQYVRAAFAMRLMLLAVPFLFLPYATGSLLNAVSREKRNSANRGVMTAASVGLNLALIPPFGFEGAAMAFIAANGLLLALDLVALRGEVPLWDADIRRLVRGAILSAIPAAILTWLFIVVAAPWLETAGPAVVRLAFALLGTALFGGGSYLVFLWLTRTLRREDLIALKAMVGKRGTV